MDVRLLAMDWRDALFAHWPIDEADLAARLPAGLAPRTHSGSAWLGIVAFVMEDIRPRGFPAGLTFGEVNLRTYVAGPDGEPGIYFFNLDAADPVGVPMARWFYKLPYFRASMDVDRRGDSVDFTSHRVHRGVPSAHFDGRYRPVGDPLATGPDDLATFLVENYRFYLAGGDTATPRSETGSAGRTEPDEHPPILYGDVYHEPWPLYEADLDLRSTNFFEVNGFAHPGEAPIAHYSPGVSVEAGPIGRAHGG